MRVVSDGEQRILDCYANLCMRLVQDFKDEILTGQINRRSARKMLHDRMSIYIRFLTRGKEDYADEMTRRFERLIHKGGKR